MGGYVGQDYSKLDKDQYSLDEGICTKGKFLYLQLQETVSSMITVIMNISNLAGAKYIFL